MNTPDKIVQSYNQVAEEYSAKRKDELSHKPLDSMLLKHFANINKQRGLCADFGCGPGQATRFLFDEGLTDIIGIDLSPAMVDAARKLSPQIKFITGDLLNIDSSAAYFGSAIAFYSIVNFTLDQVGDCFEEINRVLKPEGQFLFSFHVGIGTMHFDKADDKDVDLDMILFKTDELIKLLLSNNFYIIDAIERLFYEQVEYPTRRGYIWAAKK